MSTTGKEISGIGENENDGINSIQGLLELIRKNGMFRAVGDYGQDEILFFLAGKKFSKNSQNFQNSNSCYILSNNLSDDPNNPRYLIKALTEAMLIQLRRLYSVHLISLSSTSDSPIPHSQEKGSEGEGRNGSGVSSRAYEHYLDLAICERHTVYTLLFSLFSHYSLSFLFLLLLLYNLF